MQDHLVKAIADGVRVHAAITTDLVNKAVSLHDCYPVASAALGRTMTGALLMAANLKNKECITIKFDGNGPLGKIVADATSDGVVRGYIENPHVDLPLNQLGKLDVGGGVGAGILSVTRFTGLKDPITGSSEIVSGEIGDDLTNYLYTSEQTPSSVGVGVLVGTDLKVIAAGGFILQPLPDVTDETITKLENNLKKIRPVSTMVNDGLDAKGIIAELLQGFDVEYLSTTDLSFKCQCSKERIESVLMSLNEKDLQSLVDDGHAEVCCHFCNNKYEFSKEELEALIHVAQKLKQHQSK